MSGRLDVTTVNLARTLFNTLCQSNWQNFARAYLDCGAAIRVETQRERERETRREKTQQKVSLFSAVSEREREREYNAAPQRFIASQKYFELSER